MTAASKFLPMPARLPGELDERHAQAARALNYHHAFFDDYLRAILPHDLVLIGAPTGVGKTDIALSIASANASRGFPAHYFALEAEERELERRRKYALLARAVYQVRHPRAHELNFDDWYLGRCEDIVGEFNAAADRMMLKELSQLYTFYRGEKFDPEDLARSILEIHKSTSLIVVDHLHYVDNDSDDEHRALGETVKVVRDVALRVGKPVILVAHLRKKDSRSRKLFVELEDFHGSSNITKICTQVLSLQPALEVEAPKWYLAPTYLQILKHRRSGALRMAAVAMFDRRTRSYDAHYTLGTTHGGTKWEPLKPGSEPSWAKNHRPWDDGSSQPSAQAQLAIPPAQDVPHASSDPRFA